ncbi:MAG: AAA family ATPase [Bacteroidota bacterium]
MKDMHDDALESLKEALKHSPDNLPLRIHYAELLMEGERWEEATTQLKYVLEKDSLHFKGRLLLATLHLEQEQYSRGIVILEALKNEFPNSKQVLLLLAKAFLIEDSISEALVHYQALLKIDPEATDQELDIHLRNYQPHEEMNFEEGFDEDGLDMMEKPRINFEDVGGMKRVKEEIDLKIIKPLQHQEIYKAYGKKIGGGILLYGPPGCGKTHIARATAGQVDAKFINVGISDVLDMWVGNSERNLHEIFEVARANAPCVLFFDEIDALGASRTDMRQSNSRKLINQFLAELDGIEAQNDGLLIIGATNAPWHLDSAFRRPGRFDRIIFVEPPDQESRADILRIQLKDKPIVNIDYEDIAKRSKDYSGADLNAVIDLAIESKLAEAFKQGVPQPLSTQDLKKALKKHRPSTKDWFASARNYALYSNDSGLYDDVLTYLNIKK